MANRSRRKSNDFYFQSYPASPSSPDQFINPKTALVPLRKQYTRQAAIKEIPGWKIHSPEGKIQLNLGVQKPYLVNQRAELYSQPRYPELFTLPRVVNNPRNKRGKNKKTQKYLLKGTNKSLNYLRTNIQRKKYTFSSDKRGQTINRTFELFDSQSTQKHLHINLYASAPNAQTSPDIQKNRGHFQTTNYNQKCANSDVYADILKFKRSEYSWDLLRLFLMQFIRRSLVKAAFYNH